MADDPATSRATAVAAASLRRVSRSEWRRSVSDLLLVPVDDAIYLPDDPASEGFTSHDGLDVAPLTLELYADATEAVVARALAPEVAPPSTTLEVPRDPPPEGAPLQVITPDGPVFEAPSAWTGVVTLAHTGTWRVVASASLFAEGHAQLAVRIDGALAAPLTLDGGVGVGRTVEVEVTLDAGTHAVAVSYPTPFSSEPGAPPSPPVVIPGVTVVGPIEVPHGQRGRLVPCDLEAEPEACTRRVLAALGPRAWRRPLSEADLDHLLAVPLEALAAGESADTALSLGLQALLLDLRFLFHVEPADVAARRLDGWELAGRLAANVWGSVPDDALVAAAADGSLEDEAVLSDQLDRLLADPRALALADDLLAEWWLVGDLGAVQPDPGRYPDFDEDVRIAMREELRAFARTFVEAPRSLTEVVADTARVPDPRLAALYGAAPGEAVGALGRPGILGAAGLLTVLSAPDRSSPTRRGKFVLANLRCDPPEPPPPTVPDLGDGGSLRDRVEAHAADPACAGCHATMDPLGLALERFDGVGATRLRPPDTRTALPDGTSLDGLEDVVAWVLDGPDYARCVTEKVFTRSVGRAPTAADTALIDEVAEAAAADGLSLHAVLRHLLLHPAWRTLEGRP